MTRFNVLLPPLAALSLAGCSPQASPPPETSETTPVEAATEPAAGGESATPSPTSTPRPSETGASGRTIPLALRGRWGLVPADCTSTRGDAKGLLTIDGTTLRFYESRGTLGAVKERSETRLRAAFAFSGEGMTWTRDETLDAQDGGKTLIRREHGADAAPGPFRYARCA